jgi:hypothetical protein
MSVQELLTQIKRHGVCLRIGRFEDRLHYFPAGSLTTELVAELKEHKAEIIRVVREEEEDRLLEETGIIQSERQVFEMAREYFRGS